MIVDTHRSTRLPNLCNQVVMAITGSNTPGRYETRAWRQIPIQKRCG